MAKQEVQKEIDALKAQGMVFEFEERGKSHGPTCDHCGKTSINLIDVYAYRPGEKDEDDPLSQLAFLFGTSCIKHFDFDTPAEQQKPVAQGDSAKEVAAKIAREVLGIRTLEIQGNDGRDFREVYVRTLERALVEAFEAGMAVRK